MINLEKMDEVLAVDDAVRYIAIVGSKGNVIASQLKKNTNNTIEERDELNLLDLRITKQMLDVYDDSFGSTISLQVRREKINQLVFYHDYFIIYITCDGKADNKKITEILSKIEHLVHEMVSGLQHELEIKQKRIK